MDLDWVKNVLALLADDNLISVFGDERFGAFIAYCQVGGDRATVRLTSPTEPVYFMWAYIMIDRSDPEADMILRVQEVLVPDPDDQATWIAEPDGVRSGDYFVA